MGGADLIEVEARLGDGATATDLTPLVDAVVFACGRVGLTRATVGLVVVSPDEMASINGEHRGKAEPTDVLSFPVDGPEARDWPDDGPPPELGDILICPESAEEPLTTLAVHGLLHLVGSDHEVDDGEMLAKAQGVAQPQVLFTIGLLSRLHLLLHVRRSRPARRGPRRAAQEAGGRGGRHLEAGVTA
jgi:probable rRNA maturation factor